MNEKLSDQSVGRYLDALASEAAAPGGGAAAAVSAAQGAALLAMVCRLTEGRKKYAAWQQFAAETAAAADALRAAALGCAEADVAAFGGVAAAYALPKGTDAEKEARSAAIQRELLLCVQPPLRVMELALECVSLAEQALGKTNTNAASDLGVCALLEKAAAEGAWLNVCINAASMKDEAQARGFREAGQALLEKTRAAADRLYAAVERSF